MKCKNCNVELSEGSMFCTNCGTKVELASNQNIVDESVNEEIVTNLVEEEVTKVTTEKEEEVLVAETVEEVRKEVIEDEEANTTQDNELKDEKSEKNSSIKLSYVIFAGVGVIAALCLVFILLSVAGTSKKGTYYSNEAYSWYDPEKVPWFYTDKDELYILYPGDEEGIEIIDGYSNESQLTLIDNDKMYYIEKEKLYYKEGKKDSKLIMDDVIYYRLNESRDRMVIYNEDNELYYYNGNKAVEICDEYVNTDSLIFAEDDKSFAFIYTDKKGGEEVACISNGKEYVEIDVDFEKYPFSHFIGMSSKYVYFKTYRQKNNDTPIYKSNLKGEVTEIDDENINQTRYLEDDKFLYLSEDTVYFYDGKETEKIDNNMISIDVYSSFDNPFVKLQDQKGRVYFWREGFKELYELEDADDIVDSVYDSRNNRILYADEDNLFVLDMKGNKIGNAKEYPMKDITQIYITRSSDVIYFLEDDTLFYYELGKKEAVEIIDDYEGMDRSLSQEIIARNKDGEVYYFDGKKVVEIGDDYSRDLTIALDGSVYYYIDDKQDLYFGKAKKEVEKLEKDIKDIAGLGTKYAYLLNNDDELIILNTKTKKIIETNVEVDTWQAPYRFIR